MERLTRKGDRKLYQPLILSDRIRELYRLKQLTGLPMTVLLDKALKEFVERTEDEGKRQEPATFSAPE